MSDWIEHNSTRCPVNSSTLVDVRYLKNGTATRWSASNVNWSSVVQYRIVPGDAMHDALPVAKPPTVFVYGPQGCGKIQNAEALREFFGCTLVYDDYVDDGLHWIEEGSLHLCVKAPVFTESAGYRVLPFDYAMQLMREHIDSLMREDKLPSAELCENCGRAGGEHDAVCVHSNGKGTATRERDPNGVDAHTPGAKLDAGKALPWLCISGFSHALAAVADVTTKGARKYTPNGWVDVQDGEARYMEAFGRHTLALGRGEEVDTDTGCLHKAQMIWNLMASLELELRRANGFARNA